MSVYLIVGPPCAGKTTHALERAQPGDLVLDLDRIVQAISPADPPHDYGADQAAVGQAALEAVLALLDSHGGWTRDVYVIRSLRPGPARESLRRRLRARLVVLDAARADCETRAEAARRPAKTWYALAAYFDPPG